MNRTKQERLALTKRYVDKQERLYIAYVLSDGDAIEVYKRGQWRNHSFCNTGGCECCKNPRKVKWNSLRSQVTLAELRNKDSFDEQVKDYYTGDSV